MFCCKWGINMIFMKRIINALNIDNWKSKDVNNKKSENMSLYDIERYAKECNAYTIREERKEQNKLSFSIENATLQSNKNKEISISEAYMKINKAKRLADIANKTDDRQEFYNSIAEIENILTELSKYEQKISFSYSPSSDLRNLRNGIAEQIELLEKRIREKQKIQEENKKPIEENTVRKTKLNQIKEKNESQYKYTSFYDIEQFAKECNAYVVRKERKEQNNN